MEGINKYKRKLRLYLIFWIRIVFAKNNFKCSFINKVRANFGGGYLADQWELYDLSHNDKREYLSEYDWHKSRYINGEFDYVLNNKVIAAEMMRQYVRIPETHFVNYKSLLNGSDGKVKGYEDILVLIREKSQVVIKPISVGKGTGVNILAFDGVDYYIDKKKCDAQELIRFLKGRKNWFISEAMSQHQYASEIYNETVNTMRIITFRDTKTNEFKVFFAVQRIGTSETIPVDNGSRGGLVAKIDLETGMLSEARSLHNKNIFKVHPDSGAPIEGVRIPEWSRIKEEILVLANCMPYLQFIAWDVILTPEGEMCIIEGNSSSGVNIIQLWGGQRYGELGDFYRHHGVKC